MKTNPFVSSQARKTRKQFFNATKVQKHINPSAPLSNDLQKEQGIKRLPVRRDDEVKLVRGKYENRAGRITAVNLRAMTINIDGLNVENRPNGAVPIPVHPSNVVITKLKIDNYRKKLLERKKLGREAALAKLGRK